MRYRIFYYDITGYEEDGTEIYQMEMIECDNNEDLNYYLSVLNDEDIFDVEEA